jgi:hypothetical protein
MALEPANTGRSRYTRGTTTNQSKLNLTDHIDKNATTIINSRDTFFSVALSFFPTVARDSAG